MSATYDEEYEYDAFADGSKDAARASVAQAYVAFERNFQSEIRKVEDVLDESLYKRWDALTDPVDLAAQPYEQTNLWEIAAKGDIRVFNKLMMVFGALCKEMARLKDVAENKFIPAFISYGLFDDADEGQVQIHMAKMLALLAELEDYVARAFTVLHNCVVQLASLYTPANKLYTTTFKLVHLQTVFDHVARLLVTFVTLDRVLEGNDTLHHHWAQYKRMTEDMKKEPAHYGLDSVEPLFVLQKRLLAWEGKLLSQSIYADAVHQDFDIAGFVDMRANASLAREFAHNILAMQAELTSRLGKGDSLTNQRRFMGLCALYGLYGQLFGAPVDAKAFAQLWEVHRVIPIVALPGRSWWWPTDFLATHCGLMMGALKPKAVAEVDRVRVEVLRARDANLKVTLHQLHARATVWMTRMESNLSAAVPLAQVVLERVSLLRDGLQLANAVAAELRVLAALHVALSKPWAPEHVGLVCKAASLLKAIQHTFHRRSAMLGETLPVIIDQVQGALSSQFVKLRAEVGSARRQDDSRVDVLAALNFAINNALAGPGSADRRILLRLAMHVFLRPDMAKAADLAFVNDNMSTLEIVCNIQDFIAQACDASVLFWIRSIIPNFFEAIFRKPDHAHRLQYVFAALSDAFGFLKRSVHMDPAVLCNRYADEIEQAFREAILEPVARDIDVELRFHVHAHLGVQKERDPFKAGVKHLVALTKLRPLIFYNRTLDVKTFVEHHLDRLYYDEVAVTQHKWRGFEEQRNLAREKYGLVLTDSLLPGQTVDNELDVLQIMRNIHVFVRSYHYNLNNQIFIQHESAGKNLNSINVDVIAESIRTHGIGIMNTTVNFTFQFLKQRFITFSQFLFDDHIKARLYKDARFFKKERHALKNLYPFDRANKFSTEIRKLGVDKGLSYLDKFRILITEIGNAMGYIRMIRAAGHHFISSAIKFVPDLQDIPVFERAASDAHLSSETVTAAHLLDDTIANLSDHFSAGSEYYRTLVSVFASEFRNPKNKHLKLFYMICAPLLVNFVEHMVVSKDRVGKKGRAGENALFCDDGLALGINYILKLLDQERDFDSLHFFESAENHYHDAIAKLRHELAAMHKRRDAEQIEAKTATLAKLEKYLKEYQLVRYNCTSSKTFFLFDDPAPEPKPPSDAPPTDATAAPATSAAAPADADFDETEDDASYQASEAGGDYF